MEGKQGEGIEKQAQQKDSSMQFNPPDWAATPRRSRCAFVTQDSCESKRWSIDGKSCYVLGRSPACDIPLECKNVSRTHACIAHGGDGRVFVMDLGSVHGTYVRRELNRKSRKVRIHKR